MKRLRAFTVVEAMVTLVVAAMLLLALFSIYDRAKKISNSITDKIDSTVLPGDICQRIAEDIDRIAPPGSGARIELANSFANGFPTARLRICREFIDIKNKPQILEEVIWQATYDMNAKRLQLWRCHSGIVWEDRLLDEDERRDWTNNRHVFVPVCSGLSVFKIQVPQFTNQGTDANSASARNRPNIAMSPRFRRNTAVAQQNSATMVASDQLAEEVKYLDSWNQANMPPALTLTVSFGEPFDTGSGGFDVEEEFKTIRTIVTDRTKKVTFNYMSLTDPNAVDANDANSVDPNNQSQAVNNENSGVDKSGSLDTGGDNRRSPRSPRTRHARGSQ
ncbi:MAG: hypothetical protein A2Y07_04730 [Planctomycetes bacterium GWF2_50_10]|nr:MAG: hypothetical protein A2Y07_04730 [Planctomycetes bacterium GWF2_50_10]